MSWNEEFIPRVDEEKAFKSAIEQLPIYQRADLEIVDPNSDIELKLLFTEGDRVADVTA